MFASTISSYNQSFHRSEVLATPEDIFLPDSLWVGALYSHGTELLGTKNVVNYGNVKGISPVQTTYQIGLHMGAGCDLPHPFNGCAKNQAGFCYKPPKLTEYTFTFYFHHYFDEMVHTKDLKVVDQFSEGVLFHILINRMEKKLTNSTVLNVTNDYAAHYFNNTMEHLRARRLHLIVETPSTRRGTLPVTSRNRV
jgi:hypothetical protein